jgi:nucleoside-diphosphate-sugar epimerase
MRIAVIGGTGVVGRHTVAALRRAGHDTVVVARSRGGRHGPAHALGQG